MDHDEKIGVISRMGFAHFSLVLLLKNCLLYAVVITFRVFQSSYYIYIRWLTYFFTLCFLFKFCLTVITLPHLCAI